jgi:hypothetical protein
MVDLPQPPAPKRIFLGAGEIGIEKRAKKGPPTHMGGAICPSVKDPTIALDQVFQSKLPHLLIILLIRSLGALHSHLKIANW